MADEGVYVCEAPPPPPDEAVLDEESRDKEDGDQVADWRTAQRKQLCRPDFQLLIAGNKHLAVRNVSQTDQVGVTLTPSQSPSDYRLQDDPRPRVAPEGKVTLTVDDAITVRAFPGETVPIASFHRRFNEGYRVKVQYGAIDDPVYLRATQQDARQALQSKIDAARAVDPELARRVLPSGDADYDPRAVLQLADACRKKRVHFVDLSFPPTPDSVGPELEERYGKFWRLAAELMPRGLKPALISHSVEPNDISQGSLGDCYLCCAMAACAEYPDVVRMMFREESERKSCGDGAYNIWWVRLCVDGWMQWIVLDGYLPCNSAAADRPCFASNRHDPAELWPALLEKAYAKTFGSYQTIRGGNPGNALADLTGWPSVSWGGDHGRSLDEWRRSEAYVVWRRFRNHLAGGHLCYMSTPDRDRAFYEKQGLAPNHAYSVLDAQEWEGRHPRLGQGKHFLLKIRNPWGGAKEWDGAFGDNDPVWQDRHLKQLCDHQKRDDGTFWMAAPDCQKLFTSGGACLRQTTADVEWMHVRLHTGFTGGQPRHLLLITPEQHTTAMVWVVQGCKKRPGGVQGLYMRLRVLTARQAEVPPTLEIQGSRSADGRYHLEDGRFVNGMPVWKSASGKAIFGTGSGAHDSWMVSTYSDLKEGIRSGILNSEDHGGEFMPHRAEGWNRAGPSGFVTDPGVRCFSPDGKVTPLMLPAADSVAHSNDRISRHTGRPDSVYTSTSDRGVVAQTAGTGQDIFPERVLPMWKGRTYAVIIECFEPGPDVDRDLVLCVATPRPPLLSLKAAKCPVELAKALRDGSGIDRVMALPADGSCKAQICSTDVPAGKAEAHLRALPMVYKAYLEAARRHTAYMEEGLPRDPSLPMEPSPRRLYNRPDDVVNPCTADVQSFFSVRAPRGARAQRRGSGGPPSPTAAAAAAAGRQPSPGARPVAPPPGAQPGPPPPARAPAAPPAAAGPLQPLLDMGFESRQAEEALRVAGGDARAAIEFLLMQLSAQLDVVPPPSPARPPSPPRDPAPAPPRARTPERRPSPPRAAGGGGDAEAARQRYMEMGCVFTVQQVEAALRQAGGDRHRAFDILQGQ
eukprot:TRINITY_DN9515_c0_g2_i1.p1 TRINITY_DN9515_c0_g2~~TRINITY_DN9515_c0_g2_i1.p1  ORF type:complete len:1082 (+),score=270.29 TRINITY_DN9515_c0_g2_i1:104-3349(+)